MAEGVGFEPTVSCPTSDFESDTIDHSATLPCEGFINALNHNASEDSLLGA